jgi:hypothetical protein
MATGTLMLGATGIASMSDFDHILNWTLKRGSHPFPGPDGGTCINEAAIVACGYPYQPVRSTTDMPPCFSRPICRLALHLNDEARDAERQRLIPYVTRLACADTPEIEKRRAAYIRARVNLDGPYPCIASFDEGIRILEVALTIGRQADPLGLDDVADRMKAARAHSTAQMSKANSLSMKLKAWFGASEKQQSMV